MRVVIHVAPPLLRSSVALWLRIRAQTSKIDTLMQTHGDTRTFASRGRHHGPGYGLLRARATQALLLLLPR